MLLAFGVWWRFVVYCRVAVGAVGPFPDMDEPIWYIEKAVSGFGEVVATAAALGSMALFEVNRLA